MLGAGKQGFWSQFCVTTFLCNINAIQTTHILQGTGSESHVVMSRPYPFFSKGTDIKLLWIKVLPPESSLGLIFRSFQRTYGEPKCLPPFQRGSWRGTDLHCLRRDVSASLGGHRWVLKKLSADKCLSRRRELVVRAEGSGRIYADWTAPQLLTD